MADERNGGGDLNFKAELFRAADKLRGNLEPSEYKHVALGLIFLKYISEALKAQRVKLLTQDYANPEDPEEYPSPAALEKGAPRPARLTADQIDRPRE